MNFLLYRCNLISGTFSRSTKVPPETLCSPALFHRVMRPAKGQLLNEMLLTCSVARGNIPEFI